MRKSSSHRTGPRATPPGLFLHAALTGPAQMGPGPGGASEGMHEQSQAPRSQSWCWSNRAMETWTGRPGSPRKAALTFSLLQRPHNAPGPLPTSQSPPEQQRVRLSKVAGPLLPTLWAPCPAWHSRAQTNHGDHGDHDCLPTGLGLPCCRLRLELRKHPRTPL